MNINDLGFDRELADHVISLDLPEFSPARVTREDKERYMVYDGENDYEAEITGNLRYTAVSRIDFPAVGDWVLIKTFNSSQAIIHKVLPRKTVLMRLAAGSQGEQLICTNVDTAFIVQAINNNFNINRLERYLTICYNGGIEPVLILSKTDLVSEEILNEVLEKLMRRSGTIKYFLLSNTTLRGLAEIESFIKKGKTYCVLGSSGVGKSTLINNLLGENVLRTGHISYSTDKGRHITEHRELYVLPDGGIIIDNPGMKELGLTESNEGLSTTFKDISEYSSQCKFRDCSHVKESGCAVREAVKRGEIDEAFYNNYIKLLKEQEHLETSEAEKRRKEKIFSKIVKNYYNEGPKNKPER